MAHDGFRGGGPQGAPVVTIGLFWSDDHARPADPDCPTPRRRPMVNIQDLFDDAKCFDTIRDMRWPDGVTCPKCSSDSVIKNGRDDTQPLRQRYECRGCRQRFDDLTDTIFAGHHQPLRTWIACLLSHGIEPLGVADRPGDRININKDDARAMIQKLRQGIVDRSPSGRAGGRGRVRRSLCGGGT